MWLDEPEELPRRPRRRLLTPLPLALLGVLLIACGFIGGVLVEKGQKHPRAARPAAPLGLASRFAALRGGAAGAGDAAHDRGRRRGLARGRAGRLRRGGADDRHGRLLDG